MLDLPPLAIAAIMAITAMGVLALLQALASQMRNELELHNLHVRVTAYRNAQLRDRGVKILDVDEDGVVLAEPVEDAAPVHAEDVREPVAAPPARAAA